MENTSGEPHAWAELLARVFAIDMKSCPRCSGELKISAAIIEADAIKKILTHLNIPRLPWATKKWPRENSLQTLWLEFNLFGFRRN